MPKLVLMSDSHNLHNQIKVPDGDFLLHAGDATMDGQYYEFETFAKWFGSQPHAYHIFVAGNHDFLCERKAELARHILNQYGIIYLQDEAITIEGIKFYGSPWQPWFYDYAFNLQRGEEIRAKWRLIPDDTDVLITHGPPHRILDRINDGGTAGCEDLLNKVLQVKPKIHVFGHLHQGRGALEFNGTRFFNATVVDKTYKVVHEPFVEEL